MKPVDKKFVTNERKQKKKKEKEKEKTNTIKIQRFDLIDPYSNGKYIYTRAIHIIIYIYNKTFAIYHIRKYVYYIWN